MTYVLEATVSVTIDVIGGEPGTIKRVEGRRRDKHGPEESSIQVLGDNGSKAHPTKSLQQPGPQQPLVPPTGPPPSVGGSPPSCFFLPWMPVISSPPLCHHPGMPPPAPVPGLFPPPHASPPPLSIPTHGGLLSSCDVLICVPSAEKPVCQLQQQPTTSIWLQLHSDDERDHYYSREGSYNFEQDYHSRDNSWE
ncbi:uncharacterized protein LOC114589107 isoform X5 [Podarcis muralis]